MLYHGSPNKNIDILRPLSEENNYINGNYLFATKHKAYASIYTTHVKYMRCRSYDGKVIYVIFTMSESDYRLNDKGGCIYTIKDINAFTNLDLLESVSIKNVKYIEKHEYTSSLDAGVNVYFIDEDTENKIIKSDDEGYEIVCSLDK